MRETPPMPASLAVKSAVFGVTTSLGSDACVRCGAAAVRTTTGKLHKSSRYCSRACKADANTERRRRARADLLDSLAELERVRMRVENALQVLGLNPQRRGVG